MPHTVPTISQTPADLIAYLPVPAAVTDAAGRIVVANPAWTTLFGAAEALAACLAPPARAVLLRDVLPALEEGKGRNDWPCGAQDAAGVPMDIELSLSVLPAGPEAPARRLVVARTTSGTDRARRLRHAACAEAQAVSNTGSWSLDHGNGELVWSEEIFRILDANPLAGASAKVFLSRIHPDDRTEVSQSVRNARIHGWPCDLRHRLLLPDGTLKYVRQRWQTLPARGGESACSLGSLQDVTLAVLQEMAYKESEERFRTVADFTYDWEYWVGPGGEILYISPSCQRVTGYAQAEFINDPGLADRIVHPDDIALYMAHLAETQDTPGQVNYRILRKDGSVSWIAHGRRPVFTETGEARGHRVSCRDISDLKHAEELARRLANYDILTGLPNRRLLQERLSQALSLASRNRRMMAVMFIDLDRFKQINDTLGHDVGDRLLVEVSKRLSACVRDYDTVARAGGDEFIIVLPDIGGPLDACAVAEKVNRALRKPMKIGEHTFEVSSSIGIAVREENSPDDTLELMKKADIAMYAAKQAGRDTFRLFS